jgi:phosphoribosyl 1,2-cyclic phosphodiesterase
MRITCLSSSSSGNAYVITTESGIHLLVEAGLPYSKLRKSLLDNNFLITEMDACLISHEHNDHAAAAPDVSKHTTVYSTPNVCGKCYNQTKVKSFHEYRIHHKRIKDRYATILPFSLEHDVDNFGFIIKADNELLMFATDTKFIKWDLTRYAFDYIMIEANYNDEFMIKDDKKTSRSISSHFAFDNLITTLEGFNLSNLKELYITHLSDINANEFKIGNTLSKTLPNVAVRVCKKNGGFNTYGN